jgi:hypothetical protein
VFSQLSRFVIVGGASILLLSAFTRYLILFASYRLRSALFSYLISTENDSRECGSAGVFVGDVLTWCRCLSSCHLAGHSVSR